MLDVLRETPPGEGQESSTITYKEFKKMQLSDIVPGTVITGISPAKLFASQTWIDSQKLVTAAETDFSEGLTVPVWIGDLPLKSKPGEFQRVTVLGDKHHRTLRAWEQGLKVNGEVIGQLPKGQRIIPFSMFRIKTGDPFRGVPE